MTRQLTILIIFFTFQCRSQTAKIDTLKILPSQRFIDIASDKMNYPIIKTGSKKIDNLINSDIKTKLTNNEYPNLSINNALSRWAMDGVIHLDFEVTYNKNNIISLNISSEGCGAYCTNWTEYYNYSILTGKSIDLSTLIDTSGSFRTQAKTKIHKQFEEYRDDLKRRFINNEEGLDSSTYELTLEYCKECESAFNLSNFKLFDDTIEIIINCYVPHIMLPLTPIIELKYQYKDIKKYLRTKNWP